MHNKAYSRFFVFIAVTSLLFILPPFAQSEIQDGVSKDYYEDGTLKQEATYKNGKLDGLSKTFYPDGKLTEEVYFKDGKQHGSRKYYGTNGIIVLEENYVNGKTQGTGYLYHTNGRLSREALYKDGKLHGPYRRFDKSGSLIEAGAYVNGKHEGIVNSHDPETGITHVWHYKNNEWNGNHIVYRSTGEKFIEEDYLNGKLHGKVIIYSLDGKIVSEMNYANGEKVDEELSDDPVVIIQKVENTENVTPEKSLSKLKPEWERVYYPEFKGYIVSYERSSDWKNDGSNYIRQKRYIYEDGKMQNMTTNIFQANIKDMKSLNKRIGFKPPGSYDGKVYFGVIQYHLPRPIKLTNWVKKEKDFWKNLGMITYEEGFADIGDTKTFYYESSALTAWSKITKKEIPAENPTKKTTIMSFNDDVVLEVNYRVDHFFEQWDALKPEFERMLNSIQVTPAEKLVDKKIAKIFMTPEVAIANRGQGHIIGFSFVLPQGWSADILDVKHATAAEPGGRLAVEVFPQKGSESASLLIVAELRPHGSSLPDTGYTLLKKLIKDIDPASEEAKIRNKSLCKGHIYNLITPFSGKIAFAKTYQGKDYDGHAVKAYLYTGGNRQTVCNVIYINDLDDYENLLPSINNIFDSLNSVENMGG